MHPGSVVSIGNVDAAVSRDRVRVDGKRRGDGVLPFFLHLCMHHKQRVVWQVNGNLALCVGILRRPRVGILGQHATYTEFASDAEGYGANDGAGAEICELVAVVSDILLCAVVAIDKGGVGYPFVGRLVFELLAAGIPRFDPMLYLLVDSFLNNRLDLG